MTDGTKDSGSGGAQTTAQDVVNLYFKNVNSTAYPYDLYTLGTALLNDIDAVSTEVDSNSSSIAEIETEIEPIPTIEDNISEIQTVLAKIIFNLNEIGIKFEFNEINNFRDKYLNI